MSDRNIQSMSLVACSTCKHKHTNPDDYPCNDCWWKTLNNWSKEEE